MNHTHSQVTPLCAQLYGVMFPHMCVRIRSHFGSRRIRLCYQLSRSATATIVALIHSVCAMAYLSDVKSELTDAAGVIKLRADGDFALGMVQSICAKIKSITQWGPGPAHTLYKHIDELDLPARHAEVLVAAIDARMGQHVSAFSAVTVKAASGAPPRDQCIRFLNNYLTSCDWTTMDDPKSTPSQRDSVLAHRIDKLGIRRASEDGCIKWCLTLLVASEWSAHGEWPSYEATYSRVYYTADNQSCRVTLPSH